MATSFLFGGAGSSRGSSLTFGKMKALLPLLALLAGCAGNSSEFSPPYIASGNVGISRVHATTGLISNFGRLKQVVIEEISEKSPACQAGLSAGDQIIRIDRWKIEDLTFTRFMALLQSLEERRPGEKIIFEVASPQTSRTREIEVVVGERPKKPNQSPQRNAGVGPAILDEASALHRASSFEKTARAQPPRG